MKSSLRIRPVLPAGSRSRSHGRWRAGIITQRLRCNWVGRRWWCGPWNIAEVKELKQIRLRGIAFRQVCRAIDEAALDKLDDRSVIHRGMRHIMFARKRRYDHVRDAEPQLSRKSLLS